MRNELLGNRYRILERIGEGGMAYVYVANDEKLGRKVAIKVLHEHMERNQDIRKRFQLEAQAISSLDHPNIVKIYDFSGAQSERLWIVTEVIRGKNLAQYVQNFPGGWLNPIIAACVVREILKALDKAHATGIIHRDIKPENIMMTVEGRVKLMDFGIAKDVGKNSMTLTGTFMGSPSYMSPEQIRGRNVDLRSDLYSLAILFYEIVTGRLPYTGQTTHDVVLKIMDGEFVHPRFIVPNIPDMLNELIVRGMAKDPNQRFQSAGEFAASIEQFIAAMGFDESHIELERFFRDRKAFEDRLAKTRFGVMQAAATEQYPRRPQAHMSVVQQRGHSVFTRTTADSGRVPPPPGQAPDTRPARPARPNRPAFKGDDTWQQHLQPSGRHTPAPQPSIPKPPQAQPLAANARFTQLPAQQQASGNYAQQEPMRRQQPQQQAHYAVARAAGPYRGRRSGGIRVYRPRSRNSAVNYFFGTLLVAMVAFACVWGFMELQERLPEKRTTKTRVIKQNPARKPITQRTLDNANKKRRDGTPVAVRTIVRKPVVNTVTPAVTAKRQPVIKTTNGSSTGVKRKTSPVVASKPVIEASDPKVTVETTELKKSKAPPPPDSDDISIEVTPEEEIAFEKSEKSEKAEKQEKVEKTEKAAATEKPEKAEKQEKPAGKTSIAISSEPAAEVFIDGKRYGTTVDATTSTGMLTLNPGSHSLELRRQGYAPYRTSFTLDGGEQKNLPRIMLQSNSDGPKNGPTPMTSLTLRVNLFPAQVTIQNLDNNTSQTFSIKGAVRVVQLPSGRYQVKVEHEGEIKERELQLTGKQGQLTFAAEFKGD